MTMNKNKLLILLIIGAVIVGLGIGTVIGLQQIKSSEITTAQEENTQEETISQELTPEQIREKVKETCFGTGVAKKLHDPNMFCGIVLEDDEGQEKQLIINWWSGKKEELGDKITLPDTKKEDILIKEYTASDGSIWTLAATPPDPNLIQAIREGLEKLIREGKYNQK
jgi:hypothetical protein